TAITPTVCCRSRITLTSASASVLLPVPGAPVNPTRYALPVWGCTSATSWPACGSRSSARLMARASARTSPESKAPAKLISIRLSLTARFSTPERAHLAGAGKVLRVKSDPRRTVTLGAVAGAVGRVQRLQDVLAVAAGAAPQQVGGVDRHPTDILVLELAGNVRQLLHVARAQVRADVILQRGQQGQQPWDRVQREDTLPDRQHDQLLPARAVEV